MSDVQEEIQELLETIKEKVKSLPEKDQKEILEVLAQIEQSLRAGGSVDIPLESKSLNVNAVAGSLSKSVWARGELKKALRKHGTIKKALQNISGEVLAYLDSFSMDLIERRFKAEELAKIRANIHERKKQVARDRGVLESWLDFTIEEVDPIERYGIHPNAIQKSLRKLTEEPFYIRKRGQRAFGRGLPVGTKQKKIPIIQNGKIIGYEEASET